ncbi:ParA family protein [Vacuolonema iberomarrocanum]|uniref:ParA family protein n=1 Tax=Vacuolonema iberomarrocanum TaxID=3454632 RepID=UPI0019F4E102|nr:ParA family protein [filamentous cyanobacterium LEGE 07170]
MRSLKFLTWLDVKRLIRKNTLNGEKLPNCITSISCFSDALEIGISNADCKEDAQRTLSEWFTDWYQQDQNLIRLDLGNAALSVEFHENESTPFNGSSSIRPFWQEIAYIDSNSDAHADSARVSSNFHFPETSLSSPKVVAFYSFKGGVGRTLHLASHLFALLEASKEIDKEITVLVVDADLEAPGLTYWDRAEKRQAAVSFIDFLEAYHYAPINRQETLSLLAEEVKKNPRYEGRSTFYFLPACLNDEQLLDTPVLPEHLARSPEGEWTCGDALHQLGATLSADYVLVDLRAGLSEISSPIIFDPRIERFFVTTATEQSTAGISLVLDQISRIAPSEADSSSGKFYDPSIIISFLTPELKKLPAFENSLEKFSAAYNPVDQSDDENLYAGRLEIKETDFTQELFYVNSWEEAKNKLTSTSVMRVAKEWAVSQLIEESHLADSDSVGQDIPTVLESVRKFRDTCQQYEFAESGEGESLLVTESLKKLATTFRNDLPRVVSIGAKGSGKTFTYVQLSRLKYWETFLKLATKDLSEIEPRTHIFPLLQSSTLRDAAENIISDARTSTQAAFSDSIPEFYHSDFQDSIKSFLEEPSSELDWTRFWIKQMSRSVGLSQERNSATLSSLDSYLKQKNVRLVFLFDGLEDLFAEAAVNVQQQIALRMLIGLPKRLNEIRQANFGLIILLRRDFLRYSVTQNLAQFENLYRPYDLSWDADSFLKLVYWVCSQASVIGADEENLDSLSREELVSNLENLWGKKLGKDTSNEAYTAKWIYAALTDFKGRLQARDIVRLLYHAADITIEKSGEVSFERWSASRLLPPQAIRRAIEPCSTGKVKEVKEEYPEFKKWVDTVETKYTLEQKRAPFTQNTLSLDQTTIRMLESIGVVYEDTGKDDVSRYYMPEIYRSGLGFTLEKGARPRVLVLKRKALGADIL